MAKGKQEKTKIEESKSNAEIKKEEKLKCNKCGSSFIYIRFKSKEVCCRSCGFIEKREK